MRIGVVSNSDHFIPLAYTLTGHNLAVSVFYAPSEDDFINQKVAAFVGQANINCTQEKDSGNDLYKWVLNGNFEICFVLGYKHLIRLDKLKACATLFLNIHFGTLPAFKGPMPVFWQLRNGIKDIGVSIHQLSPKFDDGPVVWIKEIPNLPHYNYWSVNQLLSQVCIEGVFFILTLMHNKLPLAAIDRTAVKQAYQKRPGLNDVLINWPQMGAAEICNLVRACNPWNKGAISFFNGQEVKLMDAVIIDSDRQKHQCATAGTIVADERFLYIHCVDNNIINVNTLFFNDFFVPAYQCKEWGFTQGKVFG